MHCDKHVVKMIIEYAQLMSTAHRVLDGDPYEGRLQMVVEYKDGNILLRRWRKHYTKHPM